MSRRTPLAQQVPQAAVRSPHQSSTTAPAVNSQFSGAAAPQPPQPAAEAPQPAQQHAADEFDPQVYADQIAAGGQLPPGVQTYVGEDGNQYYYYYPQDGSGGGADLYDTEQNPMTEFYALASQQHQQQQQQQAASAGGGGVGAGAVAGPLVADPELHAAVAETLIRTYEYEDWTPKSNGWIVDVVTEAFFSLFFRLYLSFLLLCAGALILLLCMNYSFATLYRLFNPPDVKGVDPQWQSWAYLAIFFPQSFVTVAIACTWMDMLKGIWGVTRESTSFWGISHPTFGANKPPYLVHAVILFFTTVFPIAWAVIETGSHGRSVLRVASTYFYISVVTTMWFVAFCYGWFFWQALVEKRLAYARRFQSDDLREQRTVTRGVVETKVKSNWYYSDSALEEYGLERKTIAWTAPVFILGLIPILSMLTAVCREARWDTPNNSWVAVGVIWISVLLFLFQMISSKNHAHRTVFFSIALIIVLFILGLIGAGASSSGSLFALLFVLMLACHGMLLRKRQHELTRKEVCALMEIALDKEDEELKHDTRLDTYMCCCRNTLLAAVQWFDVKTYFGYRHPKVREFEKQRVIQRPMLRSDYKVTLLWWLAIFFCQIFVVGIGHTLQYTWSGNSVAERGSEIVGTFSQRPLCAVRYNKASARPLSMVDLSLLTVLSHNYGDSRDQDYATWFFQYTSLVREAPTTTPSTLQLLGFGTSIPFASYHDITTDFRVIVLGMQAGYGGQMLQGVDYFGDAVALQVAGILGPFLNGWAEENKQNFLMGANFFKQALDHGFDPLSSVTSFITATSAYQNTATRQSKFVIVGDQFNGGFAKILSARLGLPSVSFNAPGVAWLSVQPLQTSAVAVAAMQVDLVGGLFSLIGPELDEVVSRFTLPCSRESLQGCADIVLLTNTLVSQCGDPYGRTVSA